MNKYSNSPWHGDVQYLPSVEIITINLRLAYSRQTVSVPVLSKHSNVRGAGLSVDWWKLSQCSQQLLKSQVFQSY